MPKLPPRPKSQVAPDPEVELAPPRPGGGRTVSYSELDTYRQCPLKHRLSYRERWSKDPAEGTPLSRGSLWHVVMEEHYGVLMDTQMQGIPEIERLRMAYEKVKPHLFDSQTGRQSEDQDLIQWMYEGYVNRYGADTGWKILAIEYPFEVNLPDDDGNPSPFWMKGKIDLLVQDMITGGVWVVDHKSGKDLPSKMALEIDDQFGGYTWAMGVLKYRVMGSIHNAARTTRNKGDLPGAKITAASKPQTLEQRMGRTYLNRSATECKNIARDAWAVACNAYPEDAGFAPLPLYSAPDPRQCGWKCDFKEIHLMARDGQNIHRLLRQFDFEQHFTRH